MQNKLAVKGYITIIMDSQKNLSFEQLKELNAQFDRQLHSIEVGSASSNSFSWRKLLAKISLVLAGLVLPFLVLTRTSVFMYSNYQINGWWALTVGCFATVLLLLIYAGIFVYKIGVNQKGFKYIAYGILVLVASYSLYGVFYYSAQNMKTDEINAYYRSLHPIMRVTLTTVTLADSDLIITDIQRHPDDYKKMGLEEKGQSLHYTQKTGYVHAVDLRTKGRRQWKNWILKSAFNIVGLSTIRHVGTADHLHVYLPLNQ